jgi:hypothetical protein
MAGETEKDIHRSLRHLINEETIVHVDPRLAGEIQKETVSEEKMGTLMIRAAHTPERGWFVLFEFPAGMPRRGGVTPEVARTMSQALLKAAEAAEAHG